MKKFFFRQAISRKQSASLQIQEIGDDDDDRLSSRSSSIVSIDLDLVPLNVIDHFDGIYSHQSHKRCINSTYLTLLLLTFSVIFWMIYWMTYEYCQKSIAEDHRSIVCNSVSILQYSTIVCLCLSPLSFILMIYFWIRYSCENPIDKIRTHFVGFKLDGHQWQNQLNWYNRHFSFCSRKQLQRLRHRNFGYMILSRRGIIFDELFISTSSKRYFLSGRFQPNEQILYLNVNNYSKTTFSIYLPQHIVNQQSFEELSRILRIQITQDQILPARF